MLLAHIRIAEQLQALDDPRVSPAEVREAELRIAEEVTLLWQTDEVRHDSLRVADEIRHGLWFFEFSLMAAAVELLGDWRERFPGCAAAAAVRHLDRRRPRRQPEHRPRDDRRGSRPIEIARPGAVSQRSPGARGRAVRRHGGSSIVSDELEASLVRDERDLPEYAAEIGARNTVEPYRRKLSFMWWRLGNDGYGHPAELLDDLRVIRDSLSAHAGARIADGRVARLVRMVELFGFHLAKLDVRVHARELGLGTRDERRRGRTRGARAPRAGGGRHADRLRHVVGRHVRQASTWRTVSCAVAPLFETVDDLAAAPGSSRSCSTTRASRATVAPR